LKFDDIVVCGRSTVDVDFPRELDHGPPLPGLHGFGADGILRQGFLAHGRQCPRL
jgi:hypothetical protein